MVRADSRGTVKIDPDNDPYDPRKPEYLKPATQKEVDEANFRLLEEQIARLEVAAAKRADEDPKITHHYETVLDEMRAAASRSRPKSTFSHTRTRSAPQPAESVPSQQEQGRMPYQIHPPQDGGYMNAAALPDSFAKKLVLPMVTSRIQQHLTAQPAVPVVALDLRVKQPQHRQELHEEEGVRANAPPETRGTTLKETGPGARMFTHRRVRSAPGQSAPEQRFLPQAVVKVAPKALNLNGIKEEEVGFISF